MAGKKVVQVKRRASLCTAACAVIAQALARHRGPVRRIGASGRGARLSCGA